MLLDDMCCVSTDCSFSIYIYKYMPLLVCMDGQFVLLPDMLPRDHRHATP